ncbi:MAG TPA: DivIVA domain-containing protein [Acidimicrobiia bacterium]
MDLSSEDVSRVRFTGTRHAYDRREVDAFLLRVASALLAHEKALATAQTRIDRLQKAVDQANAAVAATRRRPDVRARSMARPALGESESSADDDRAVVEAPAPVGDGEPPLPVGDDTSLPEMAAFETWRLVQGSLVAAVEVLAEAREEARLGDALSALHREEDAQAMMLRSRKEVEGIARRAAEEASDVIAQAEERAAGLIAEGRAKAEEEQSSAEAEIVRLNARLTHLRAAIADVQGRLQQLSLTTSTEFSMIGDLIDLDTKGIEDVMLRQLEDAAAVAEAAAEQEEPPPSPRRGGRRKQTPPAKVDTAATDDAIDDRLKSLRRRLDD